MDLTISMRVAASTLAARLRVMVTWHVSKENCAMNMNDFIYARVLDMELRVTASGTLWPAPKVVFTVSIGGHTGEWDFTDLDLLMATGQGLEPVLGEPHTSTEQEDVSMTAEWTFTDPNDVGRVTLALADALGEPDRSTEAPGAMSFLAMARSFVVTA